MALDVIGAGWGRTGTESLKTALEMLGFDTCYHMFELVRRSRHAKHWHALARGEQPDWDDLFRGFRSAVDFPAARYYRELGARYPEAKIVLTVRDPAAWYESARKTILRPMPLGMRVLPRALGLFSPNLRGMGSVLALVEKELFEKLFEGRASDRDFMIDRFTRWNDEVKRTVPAERLLVYDVKEGWGPLCAFLGKPVPSVPFPRANDGAAFAERTKITNLVREFWTGAD